MHPRVYSAPVIVNYVVTYSVINFVRTVLYTVLYVQCYIFRPHKDVSVSDDQSRDLTYASVTMKATVYIVCCTNLPIGDMSV